MPRFIPRILNRIAQFRTVKSPKISNPRRRKSLRKPVPTGPVWQVSEFSQSILLQPANPIAHSSAYVQHKRLPPRVFIPRTAEKRHTDVYDQPRMMTSEERAWWSSPYLRMLSSPLRRCSVTQAQLPSDFLIRLVPMRTRRNGATSTSIVLVPDGLEHPRFQARRAGRAVHVLCWRTALQQLHEKAGSWKGLTLGAAPHAKLVEQTQHLLRVRVLQEVQLILERVGQAAGKKSNRTPLLRRLTREEFASVKSQGHIPFENALAILVLPPVNRDSFSREDHLTAMSPLPLPDAPPTGMASFPLSTLLPQDVAGSTGTDPVLPRLSQPHVPIYNGVVLFPHAMQRSALHKMLRKILAGESQCRQKPTGAFKDSHAFLISADADIMQRADIPPLAIALWRLRIFQEESDWNTNPGWSKRMKYRSLGVFE